MDLLASIETVREALHALDAAGRHLARTISARPDLPASVCRHEHGMAPTLHLGKAARQVAGEAFFNVDFHDDQDEKRVVRFVGALAAGTDVIKAANTVNVRKAAFAEAVQQYRRLSSRRQRDSHQVRDLLIRFGAARLSLVQAYRKIPVLDFLPERIGFSWIMGTQHVKTLPRDEAMQRIDPETHSSKSQQRRIRQSISSIPVDELRLVERVAPHVRANVRWTENDERRGTCIHAPLPILYPFLTGQMPPTLVGHERPEPDPSTRAVRQRRSDARLKRIEGTFDIYKKT